MPKPTKAPNAAFVASACGDWEAASEVLRGLVEDGANYAVRFRHSFVMPGWRMLLMMRLSATFHFFHLEGR